MPRVTPDLVQICVTLCLAPSIPFPIAKPYLLHLACFIIYIIVLLYHHVQLHLPFITPQQGILTPYPCFIIYLATWNPNMICVLSHSITLTTIMGILLGVNSGQLCGAANVCKFSSYCGKWRFDGKGGGWVEWGCPSHVSFSFYLISLFSMQTFMDRNRCRF